MEIYIKTELSLDTLAETIRETLNLPERNRARHAEEQRRYGVNYGGEYYSFEALGIWLNLLKNAGEVEIPERTAFPYYLLAEAGAEADWEAVDCLTRQVYAVLRRTGLDVDLASLAS